MTNMDERIGENLTRYRGTRSQEEVAEYMRSKGFKWSQATVWSVEKGKRALRLSEAHALAELLSPGLSGPQLFVFERGATGVSEALEKYRSTLGEFREAVEAVLEAHTDLWNATARLQADGFLSEDQEQLFENAKRWAIEDGPFEEFQRAYRAHHEIQEDEDDLTRELKTAMIEDGVTSFRELVEHRDRLAQKRGYENWEEMQSGFALFSHDEIQAKIAAAREQRKTYDERE